MAGGWYIAGGLILLIVGIALITWALVWHSGDSTGTWSTGMIIVLAFGSIFAFIGLILFFVGLYQYLTAPSEPVTVATVTPVTTISPAIPGMPVPVVPVPVQPIVAESIAVPKPVVKRVTTIPKPVGGLDLVNDPLTGRNITINQLRRNCLYNMSYESLLNATAAYSVYQTYCADILNVKSNAILEQIQQPGF